MPLDPARPARDFGLLIGLTTVLNAVVTANGVPALFTPLARSLSDASALPLLTVLIVQVIRCATLLLPYQPSAMIVAMGTGKVPARNGLMLCLVPAAATFTVLAPLDFLRFRLLGLLSPIPTHL